jgi:hypothetical protein
MPVTFDVTGLFMPRDGADPYWDLSYIPAGGRSASGRSITYGPLVVSPAAFGPGLTMLSGSWVAQPDMRARAYGNLDAMSARVGALPDPLPGSSLLIGIQLTTNLPSVLSGAAADQAVARSLLVISALQLLVLTLAALIATGRLLDAQREAEITLLVARRRAPFLAGGKAAPSSRSRACPRSGSGYPASCGPPRRCQPAERSWCCRCRRSAASVRRRSS